MTTLTSARVRLFRIAYRALGLLCLTDAGMILASLPLADQPKVSKQAIIVSIVVSIAFTAAGLLVLRISVRLSNLYLLTLQGLTFPALETNLRGLLTDMITAGLAFLAIMGLGAFALLHRIQEGFAVFG